MNHEKVLLAIGDIDAKLISRVQYNQRQHKRKGLMAAVIVAIIMCGTCLAVVAEWDFFRASFREQVGFIYPDHQWGMSPDEVEKATGYTLTGEANTAYRFLDNNSVSFWGFTPRVMYQFSDNRLIGVDLKFNSNEDPKAMTELKEKLVDSMTKTYGQMGIQSGTEEILTDGLQEELRKHLNIDTENNEAQSIEGATGLQTQNISKGQLIRYYWTNLSTAVSLTVSYGEENIVKNLELSFSYIK